MEVLLVKLSLQSCYYKSGYLVILLLLFQHLNDRHDYFLQLNHACFLRRISHSRFMLYHISLNKNIVAIKRTDYAQWIVMNPIIRDSHIVSSSMRVQSVLDVVVILVTINYDIVCSIGIKCKPHMVKFTTSYFHVMRWSISK